MTTKELESIRRQVKLDMLGTVMERIRVHEKAFYLLAELAQIEYELYLSRIIDLCHTGK